MKKNLKRTLAKVMAVALTVAMAGTAAPDADAAKKVSLSKKSITVTKGKSKTVTIKLGKKTVKKNQVKKLTVKSSKASIATAKKAGKTGVKVTGKKKGNAKVTVKVTVKGQKAKTLTLKVKVTNPKNNGGSEDTPSTTAPATSAPATSAPATSAPAGDGNTQTTPPAGGNTQTTPPAGGDTQTTPPAGGDTQTTPPATTAPVVLENPDISLAYNYEFPGARQVLFTDAESGLPGYTINVAQFTHVAVTIESTEKLPEESNWTGKVTLSTTDEGAGQNAWSNGIFLKYLGNGEADAKYDPEAKQYVVVFEINPSNLMEGFEEEDIALIDCISMQLATENYDKTKLTKIEFFGGKDLPDVPDTPTQTPSGTETKPVESPAATTPAAPGEDPVESPAATTPAAPGEDPVESPAATPVAVSFTNASAQGFGSSPTIAAADTSVKVTTTGAYSQGVKTSVALGEKKITDYWGISVTITLDADSTSGITYKPLLVELKNKNAEYLQGPGATDQDSGEAINVTLAKTPGNDINIAKDAEGNARTQTVTLAFPVEADLADAEAISGTINMVIGVNTNEEVIYTISDVKLLLENPDASAGAGAGSAGSDD